MPNLPENVLIALVVVIALVVLLIPVMLRLAGLTGQQIIDLLTMTAQFALNLAREFRSQNKNGQG